MTRHHITTKHKDSKLEFILAVDAAYYRNELCHVDGKIEGLFSRPINRVPHDMFCATAQSYLTIREREYLDESTSYIVGTNKGVEVISDFIKNAKGEKKKGDPRYKQLLPYLIARQLQVDGTYLYFPYRRTKKVGESRLADNGSLGYGGHIDLEDIVSTKSVIDLKATILKSALREAIEEFTLNSETFGNHRVTAGVYAEAITFSDLFIVDDSNDVGELHLGIIMYFDVPAGWTLEASEDELAKLPPMTAEQMLTDPAFNGENWTMIYLNHIAEPTFEVGEGGDDDFAGDIEVGEDGLERELMDTESEDDIPGSGRMSDGAPLYHYSTSDIADLSTAEINLISEEEFADLNAAQLLAFKDEHILAMSSAQVSSYRMALVAQINGNHLQLTDPTEAERSSMLERLDDSTNPKDNNDILSLDHGGVKVGEIERATLFVNVPEGEDPIAAIRDVVHAHYHRVDGDAATPIINALFGASNPTNIEVTAEEEEHFRFMNDGAPKRDE
jgi:predicted NUDIX family phosphoesterase